MLQSLRASISTVGRHHYLSTSMAEISQTARQTTPDAEIKLAKLSTAEFRVYNNMAEHMEYFVSFALGNSDRLGSLLVL